MEQDVVVSEMVVGNRKEINPVDFQHQLQQLVSTVGTVKLTEEQKKILYDKIPDEAIEIRPDGLIYLPWTEYASRLHQAFGFEWGLVPCGMPKLEGNLILWGFYLVVQGKLMGFAIGQQEYHPNNPKMTWGDAVEGAKSNALMRLCKERGIGSELWRPSFIQQWKEKYAETHTTVNPKTGKKETYWRKKGNKINNANIKANDNIREEKVSQPQPQRPVRIKYVNTWRRVPQEYWEKGRDRDIIGGEGYVARKSEVDGNYYIYQIVTSEEAEEKIKKETKEETKIVKSVEMKDIKSTAVSDGKVNVETESIETPEIESDEKEIIETDIDTVAEDVEIATAHLVEDVENELQELKEMLFAMGLLQLTIDEQPIGLFMDFINQKYGILDIKDFLIYPNKLSECYNNVIKPFYNEYRKSPTVQIKKIFQENYLQLPKKTGKTTKTIHQGELIEIIEDAEISWQDKVKSIPPDILKLCKLDKRIDLLSDEECQAIWEEAHRIADKSMNKGGK